MIEELNFEWFEGGRSPVGEYAITILKTGVINLSQALYLEKLSSFGYIKFGFDKEKRVIGLQLMSSKASGAYEIRSKDGKSPRVSGIAFLKAYKIKNTETKRYEAEWDEETKMVLVKLGKEKGEGGE